MKCYETKDGGTLSSQENRGQSALYKEDTMKRKRAQGKPEFRSPLLNILVVLMVMVAFGAMFSTGCKDDAEFDEESFVMAFETGEVLDGQTDDGEELIEETFSIEDCDQENEDNSDFDNQLRFVDDSLRSNVDLVNACMNAKPDTDSEINKLEPNARDCTDKVGTDIVASAKDWPDNVDDDTKNDVVAGIGFGKTPGNFGGFPLALLGVLTPAVAISRRRRTMQTKSYNFFGFAILAAMLGVVMLAKGFALAVSLTPLLAVGVATLLMTAKKPEFAFAALSDEGSSSSNDKCIHEMNAVSTAQFKGNYKDCLEAFRLVANMGDGVIRRTKKDLAELCFETPEAVEKAYSEVFGG